MDIQEQVKLMSNTKHRMKLNGIKNVKMLRLPPIELYSIITWKSITVHSKSLLLDQWTLCANIARHLSLKMKLMVCVAQAVKSNWRHWYRYQSHYIHYFPVMGQILNIFKLISSNTIIVFKWHHMAQQKLFKKIVCQLSRFRVKYIIIYIHSLSGQLVKIYKTTFSVPVHGSLHKRGMQAKVIWKHDSEANIWAQEGWERGVQEAPQYGTSYFLQSPYILSVIKSRRLRWADHIARMEEGRSVFKIVTGTPAGKRSLGRPRHRWDNSIRMDLKEIRGIGLILLRIGILAGRPTSTGKWRLGSLGVDGRKILEWILKK